MLTMQDLHLRFSVKHHTHKVVVKAPPPPPPPPHPAYRCMHFLGTRAAVRLESSNNFYRIHLNYDGHYGLKSLCDCVLKKRCLDFCIYVVTSGYLTLALGIFCFF